LSAIETSTLRPAAVARPADEPTATGEAGRAGGLPIKTGPRIAGLAVSDGEHVLTQDQVLDRLGLRGDEFAEGIFARCGVERRRLDLSDEFLDMPLSRRGEIVEAELLRHAVDAVDALELDPAEVGTIVTASLYTLGCPTLAHRLIDHYGMDPTTDKYHVTGVGCASGVPLMRLTGHALREHPHKQALIVAAESMSSLMTRAKPEDPRAKTVGASIFGDGCAAAVLSSDPRAEGPIISASQVHQIGDTLDAVSLKLAGEDSYLHLAKELPDLAGSGLDEIVDRFLHRNNLTRRAIDHWVVHPGGRRIIENVQGSLALSDADVAVSWEALADHGNIGTPSIFYVLKETVEQRDPAPGERGLMVTIGPGVTVGLMLLAW
jgi:alkylresorcinol/alkylpyrone synthase